MHFAKDREGSSGGSKIIEPLLDHARPPNASKPATSSLVKDKGKAVLVEQEYVASESILHGLILDSIPLASFGHIYAPIASTYLTPQLFPATTHTSLFSCTTLNVTQSLSLVSPLESFPSLPDGEADSSNLLAHSMDHDRDDDIFLELEDLHDFAISTESAKKKS